MPIQPAQFDGKNIRRVYDEKTEIWWFSVIDVVQALTDSANARDYWFKMKQRVRQEDGAELSTICRQLKMPAADGKQRLTDVATAASLLRIVQSIPSPKAEPIKLWLAKVSYQRMQEMADPALSLDRARETWQQHGRSEKWIQQRMTGQETRNKLTDYWANHEIKKGREFAILTNIIHREWSHASVKLRAPAPNEVRLTDTAVMFFGAGARSGGRAADKAGTLYRPILCCSRSGQSAEAGVR